MSNAELTLEYFKIFLSPQMVTGMVVVVVLCKFKRSIEALIARIVKFRLPGGGELSITQSERSSESPEKTKDMQPAPEPVSLPDGLTLTPEQVNEAKGYIEALKANAAIWEYRYLNYFLVPTTQTVLNWLDSLKQGTTLSLFENLWISLTPSSNERKAIIGALESHSLIKVTGELVEITPKGKGYIQWRGPLPPT